MYIVHVHVCTCTKGITDRCGVFCSNEARGCGFNFVGVATGVWGCGLSSGSGLVTVGDECGDVWLPGNHLVSLVSGVAAAALMW